jgi:lipopolysaccharide transport system ATP-binding protein
MSDLAISVENLGKQYRIGQVVERHGSLREALAHAARAPLRSVARLRGGERNDGGGGDDLVWALRDVSFQVRHGEAVGIIGRNGAGKSTLLKILSRITPPSRGRALVWGRVGSLLEVGTGFHPELTGRDNVYLNGSILGMDRAHIDRKFDEIVSFSGVERYLDTPVKRYSSGMYLRLAFAVAAHLEPEVLIVDEVLAVGDAEFQKKCLGKMGEVAKEGRTVLFVSHHMGAVRTLCDSVVLLRGGCSVAHGDPGEIIARYLDVSGEMEAPELVWEDLALAPGSEELKARALRVRDESGRIANEIPDDEEIRVEIEYEVLQRIWNAQVGFQLLSADGNIVLESYQGDRDGEVGIQEPGRYRWVCRIPGMFLNSGQYFVKLWGYVPDVKWLFPHEAMVPFSVTQLKHLGADRGKRPGVIRTRLDWEDTSPTPVGRPG